MHNLQANAQSIAAYLRIDENQRAISNLPLHYCYGLSVVNSHLLAGGSIILTDESVTQNSFWELFRQEQACSFAGVPYTYEILDRRGFETMDLPSLQYFTQAGGRLSSQLVEKFARYALKTQRRFYVMYGQTEATARIAYVPPEKLLDNSHCIGRVISRGEIRLLDGENEIHGVDKAAELVYHGPNVMMGYAEKRCDLAGVAGSDVLRTGDIACRNKEGLYYIVGRNNRFLKLFGWRLNLDEVENWLSSIGHAVLCGGNDRLLVIMTVAPGESEYIKGITLSRYKLSASSVLVIERAEFPRLASGKADYQTLKGIADDKTEKQQPAAGSSWWTNICGLPSSCQNKFSQSVKDCFKEILDVSEAADIDSFQSLSGDSLSYVNVSIELEKRLGYLPGSWETMSIAELESLARQTQRPAGREESMWNSLNYFRCIAILLIVAAHCLDASHWVTDTFVEKVLVSIVRAGTTLFVFISGFFFYQLNAAGFRYGRFMKSKANTLLIPYVVLSLLAMVGRHYLNEPIENVPWPPANASGVMELYIWPGLLNLLTGASFAPYWYIPFIMLIFLMAPLHLKVLDLSVKAQIVLVCLLFVISLLVHRPAQQLYVLQSLVFFTPLYLFGMLCCRYRVEVYRMLADKELLLFAGVPVFAVLQIVFYNENVMHKDPFVYNGIDVQLIQKVCMCLFLLVVLRRVEKRRSKIVDLISSCSFAIYFLHLWFVKLIEKYMAGRTVVFGGAPLLWCFCIVAGCTASIIVAIAFKKVLKSKSKYFTGY